MQFEKIRKISKSKMIIGGLIGLGVIGAITILPSYSKYRTTQSFNLVNGKITYKIPDFNLIAMKQSEDGKSYTDINIMPGSEYVINEDMSECKVNGTKDEEAILKTINGNHVISKLQKGSKCYLYFDKKKEPADQTLANLGITTTPSAKNSPFTQTSAQDGSLGLYKTADPIYGGNTYYYRGAVTNNYVVFAGKCWRIIRINGNGSIRLILDSNDATCKENGKGENAIDKQKYNAKYDDNAYVGYMKGLNNTGTSGSYEEAHANTYNSDIKAYLDNWYDTNIASYASYIDEEAGFCNDRTVGSSGNGYGNSEMTFYAAYDRIAKSANSATPTFGCTRSEDLFTPSTSGVGNKILGTESGSIKSRPIGLITVDEVVYAGALYGSGVGTNQSYYLYNGNYYWTMSPYYYSSTSARVFDVYSDGCLGTHTVTDTYGVRPVINLKAGAVFKAGTDGTIGNEYEVVS